MVRRERYEEVDGVRKEKERLTTDHQPQRRLLETGTTDSWKEIINLVNIAESVVVVSLKSLQTSGSNLISNIYYPDVFS